MLEVIFQCNFKFHLYVFVHFSFPRSNDEQFCTCNHVCLLWTRSFWSLSAKISLVEETHYLYSVGKVFVNLLLPEILFVLLKGPHKTETYSLEHTYH